MFLAALTFLVLFHILPFSDPNNALWCAFITYLVIRGIALTSILPRFTTPRYYIGIGSTILDREAVIRAILSQTFGKRKLRLSSFYRTPEEEKGEREYLNAVAELRWGGTPATLVTVLKRIEKQAGRRPKEETKEVALDLDLVVADDEVLRPKDYERDYFKIGFRQLISS